MIRGFLPFFRSPIASRIRGAEVQGQFVSPGYIPSPEAGPIDYEALGEGPCGRSSMVERQPSKLNVEGSNPFARFAVLGCVTLRNVARRP